jgi:hypothetical protein
MVGPGYRIRSHIPEITLAEAAADIDGQKLIEHLLSSPTSTDQTKIAFLP